MSSIRLPTQNHQKKRDDLELQLLLEAIYEQYGHDFRDYSRVHVKRRVKAFQAEKKLKSISELQHSILYQEEVFYEMLLRLSLNVTEMFRDPRFFKAMREQVVPYLKTYPFLKIWHAGCATGEEVYSMAILLTEEKLYEKSLIYATDFNQVALDVAREGIYAAKLIKQFSANYQQAGGQLSLSDYLTVQYESVILKKELHKNIVFSDHNLVTDGVFNEMNLIICRNVLIYFNRELQNKVLKLLFDSLVPGGILCLGSKETLMFSDYKDKFSQMHQENIFKKNYD